MPKKTHYFISRVRIGGKLREIGEDINLTETEAEEGVAEGWLSTEPPATLLTPEIEATEDISELKAQLEKNAFLFAESEGARDDLLSELEAVKEERAEVKGLLADALREGEAKVVELKEARATIEKQTVEIDKALSDLKKFQSNAKPATQKTDK